MAGEMAERIGARIRKRRLELGMKQRELADKLGSDAIDNQRISDWERGVNRPSDRYMEQLALALERDVSWFYRDSEDAPTPSPFPETPAIEGVLADVLAEIKAQLTEQTRVLEEIKAELAAQQQAKTETEAATQRLLAAVDDANRALLADAQQSAEEPAQRAK